MFRIPIGRRVVRVIDEPRMKGRAKLNAKAPMGELFLARNFMKLRGRGEATSINIGARDSARGLGRNAMNKIEPTMVKTA